ncbi:monocarboxylate transporter 13-like [Haemaphysalis longicornis]
MAFALVILPTLLRATAAAVDTSSTVQGPRILEAASTPPDGGWGWMVVLAGFICYVVTDGILYSSGVFFEDFLVVFHEGHGATSWISSITFGCYHISSPLATGLSIRYGCRPVAIVGSLLSSLGLFISIFATSIRFLYFSLGLATGLGFGLMLLPTSICGSTYFDRHRSLATGIMVCGSGVGTSVMAPVLEALIGLYGWKGALIICSGISLQGVVTGSLLRPLPLAKDSYSGSVTSFPTTSETSEPPNERPLWQSLMVDDVSTSVSSGCAVNGRGASTRSPRPGALQHAVVPFERRTDDFKSHVRLRGDIFGVQPSMTFSAESSMLQGTEQRSTHSTIIDNHSIIARTLFSYKMPALLGEILNFRLFATPVFGAFALSRFLYGIGYSVPYLFTLSRAVTDLGTSETDGSFLLSLMGFTNVLGRLSIGLASDFMGRHRIWLCVCCVIICGLSTVLSVLATTYSSMQLYAATYGTAAGGFITVSSVIVGDLVAVDRLANAQGLSALSLGVAGLIGPPLSGWVLDATRSFNPAFVLAGASIYMAGVVLLFVPYLQWTEGRRSSSSSFRLEEHLEET